MSLKFYYAPMSTASATAAVIAELGVFCEHIKLDIQAGDTKKPEFLKINPNGLVPVIIHEGTVIWESAAIAMYLGETFGVDAKLYPQAGLLRGEAMKWITWTNVTLAEAGSRLAYSMNPGSEEVATKARADLSKGLKIIDSALATKPYLLGDYSLVDTHLASFIGWLGMMSVSLQEYPHLASWFSKCSNRPAVKGLQ